MKKLILTLPVALALQGCSTMMPAEGLDLVSTKEKTAATVIGAAVGGYLGGKAGGSSAAGKNLGRIAGTYIGMIGPATLWKKYGGQLYTETTTVRRNGYQNRNAATSQRYQ
ncbi:MAG: hypothetical protein ACPG47_06045 [Leucothrix sp.]